MQCQLVPHAVILMRQGCNRSAEGEAISRGMGDLLESLVTHGRPSCVPSGPSTASAGGHCLAWPAFTAAEGQTMVFGNWYDSTRPLTEVVPHRMLERVLAGGERKLERACDFLDSTYWDPASWDSYPLTPPAAVNAEARAVDVRAGEALLPLLGLVVAVALLIRSHGPYWHADHRTQAL
jgi:hypothetical protein